MYLSLIILPLLGCMVSGLFGRKVGVSGSQIVTCGSVMITTMLSTWCFFEAGINNIPVAINLFRWIDSEWYNIIWAFQYDSLTVYFVGLYFIIEIEAVLVLIQLYKVLIQLYKVFIQKLLINPSLKIEGVRSRFKPVNDTIFTKGYTLKLPLCNITNKIINKKMNYSTISDTDGDLVTEKGSQHSFLQWFAGFTDAEGNFAINSIFKKDKLIISSFSFMFKIALHKDDQEVLRYIKDKLNIGGVRLYKDECIFNVTDQKGILKLISIFDKYHLNTSKYLDYLDFKEAFLLYTNRDINLETPDQAKGKILEFKNKMNTSRIYFDRPENSPIIITKSWLLGFIEGDGSFFLRRDTLTPTFSIENTGVQLPVLVKIKEYLENSLGFNSYSLYKLKNSSTIAITTVKAKNGNSKSSVSLVIQNIYVLNNYLIPFFADLQFLTKKGKDFQDFSIISKVVYGGAYKKEEIKSLILKLSNTMNNFRLSTYKGLIESLSSEDLDKLLNTEPVFKHLQDGRVVDSTTKKILHRQSSCVYEICEKDGSYILAISLNKAASIVGLYPETLSRHLDKVLNSEFVEIKDHQIRRIPVFFPLN